VVGGLLRGLLLGKHREGIGGSDVATDPVSVDADYDNGGVAFRAALSGEGEDMGLEVMVWISRLVYSRAARGRRRGALLVPRNRC
jgi:hypothetical protein